MLKMDFTKIAAKINKIVSAFLTVTIMFSATFGIVNPPLRSFKPKDIVEEIDNSPKMTLTDNGQSGYVIVKGAAASKSENTAASKLQSYLKQISGVELPVVTDTAPAREKEIIVGKTNREGNGYNVDRAALGDEGFVIKTAGAKVIIAGGEKRGTLYGVFDFLEKFLDCAWLSSDITVIPEKSTVCVPATIDVKETPAYTFRSPSVVRAKTVVSADYCLANKINGLADSVQSEELGGSFSYNMGHNADVIMPASVYFAGYPEYYALDENGARNKDNPCMTNEAVIKIFTDYAVNLVKSNPDLQSVNICLNDSGTYCHCDKCEAVYAEEGGATSGTLIRMLNIIADKIAQINPNCKLITLAYACSVDAPLTIVRDNILVYFCPISMCYAHPLETDTYSDSQLLCKQLIAWGKVCKNIIIFEYPVNYNLYPQPYPIWDSLQPNIQYYYKNNARGLYICCNAYCDPNLFVMNSWLYAKLLWNPYADIDKLENQFLKLYYGAGWQYIKEYIRLLSEECSGKTIAGIENHMTCCGEVTGPGYIAMTKNQITYCNELWDNAKKQAKEARQLTNVRYAEISWRVWKSYNFMGEFTRAQAPSVWIEANKKLFADMNELGLTQCGENDSFVSETEFKKLQLYYLNPLYWTWRKLGRERQYTANTLWDIVKGWISEI